MNPSESSVVKIINGNNVITVVGEVEFSYSTETDNHWGKFALTSDMVAELDALRRRSDAVMRAIPYLS